MMLILGNTFRFTGTSLCLAVTLCGAVSASAGVTPRLFWADWSDTTISRANLDGSNSQVIINSASTGGVMLEPYGIAVDRAAGMVYWVDFNNDRVMRADINGNNVEDLRPLDATAQSFDIDLEPAAGKMYWTESGDNEISRADLDGNNEEVLINTGLSFPLGVAVDPDNNHFYFCDGGNGAIKRANLDGSNVTTILGGLDLPVALAIDRVNNHLYWSDDTTQKIERMNLDGTGRQEVIGSIGSVFSIALDPANSQLYWTDRNNLTIERANFDGSARSTLLSGLSGPIGIALMVNASPVVNAGGPYNIDEGQGVGVTAAASLDPDGDALTFNWDIDNDGVFDDGSGVSLSLTWAMLNSLGLSDGPNTIRVAGDDGFGAINAAATLTINNLPPNADAGGPYSIDEGQSVSLNALASTDPGGDSLAYAWDLNSDGSFSEAFGGSPIVPWSTLQSAGLNEGTHTIAVRADDGAATNDATAQLDIANLPPNPQDDAYNFPAQEITNEPAPGLLENDTDPGNDTLSTAAATLATPLGAQITIQTDGSFTYDPTNAPALQGLFIGQTATDSFSYTAYDGATTRTAQVTLTLHGALDPGTGTVGEVPAAGFWGLLALAGALVASKRIVDR